MSVYEASITNPKKQLEFYKDLSEQLQREKKILEHNNKTLLIQKEEAYKIANDYYEENQELKDELEWYKQQCDDLEMQIGCQE